jgi:hypothetical protein
MANDGHPPSRPDGTNHGQDRKSITQPDRVKQTTETMWRAASLRAAGATFREIGEALGYDPTWVRTLVLRALEESKHESADLMRTQEGVRLDRLQRAHWPHAVGSTAPDGVVTPPDQKAALVILRVMDRRARLFGLDAPVQVEVEVAIGTTEIDAEVAALVQLLDDADRG